MANFERIDPHHIDIEHQLKEARREVTMRLRVYERWVNDGRMSPETASRQLAGMQAIVLTLERLEAEERLAL
jgi:hypothetical protein